MHCQSSKASANKSPMLAKDPKGRQLSKKLATNSSLDNEASENLKFVEKIKAASRKAFAIRSSQSVDGIFKHINSILIVDEGFSKILKELKDSFVETKLKTISVLHINFQKALQRKQMAIKNLNIIEKEFQQEKQNMYTTAKENNMKKTRKGPKNINTFDSLPLPDTNDFLDIADEFKQGERSGSVFSEEVQLR